MPRYFFHLSDGEQTFIDDNGKQLEDARAAHSHALLLIDKIREFIPEATNSTWKIKIMIATGQSVMTVISPGPRQAAPKQFGKRTGREKTR